MGFRFMCTKCGKKHEWVADHPYPCEACGAATWATAGWMKKQGCLVVRDEVVEDDPNVPWFRERYKGMHDLLAAGAISHNEARRMLKRMAVGMDGCLIMECEKAL